jgi:hypothetical protein
MADRVIAKMWIDGTLSASRAQVLIAAINDSEVCAEEGDLHFQPGSAADLMKARTHDGYIYLYDDEAPWGEMEIMTETCRRLDLPFKHWNEASSVTRWRSTGGGRASRSVAVACSRRSPSVS